MHGDDVGVVRNNVTRKGCVVCCVLVCSANGTEEAPRS
jgi:hypothetical protein